MCVTTMIDPNHRLVTTCEIAGISAIQLDVPSWVQKRHKGHTDTHDNYKKSKKPIAISHTNTRKRLCRYIKASLKKPTVMCVLMTQ
jgi:hypothetical protein